MHELPHLSLCIIIMMLCIQKYDFVEIVQQLCKHVVSVVRVANEV